MSPVHVRRQQLFLPPCATSAAHAALPVCLSYHVLPVVAQEQVNTDLLATHVAAAPGFRERPAIASM